MSRKRLVCIQCPQSCSLQVERQGDEIKVTGNKCPRGRSYGEKELVSPSRTLTSTVKTCFPDFPRLSVRTEGEIPLGSVFKVMQVINGVLVSQRLQPGDVVVPRLTGTDVALIATADMTVRDQQAATGQ